MRVITGKARGVQLKTPDGMQTRPTADRVKEAMFSIINFDIPGAKVLDLFGGTGQLGIEALSRDASTAVFVDSREDVWANSYTAFVCPWTAFCCLAFACDVFADRRAYASLDMGSEVAIQACGGS